MAESPASPTSTEPQTCHWCGRTCADAAELLAWTTAVEEGRTVRFCAACSREHLRAIEGKLDSAWW